MDRKLIFVLEQRINKGQAQTAQTKACSQISHSSPTEDQASHKSPQRPRRCGDRRRRRRCPTPAQGVVEVRPGEESAHDVALVPELQEIQNEVQEGRESARVAVRPEAADGVQLCR